MRFSRASARRGFTLMELVISSAIASIVLVAGYVCLRAGIATQQTVETRSDLLQSARVALAMMAADLRTATPLSTEYEFVGMNRTVGDVTAANLDFATHHYTPRRPHEGDFCEVSYFVDQNQETGGLSLWRRRDSSPDDEPLTGGSREEIVSGVRGLLVEYYDGFEWFETWGDPTGRTAGQDRSFLASNQYGLPEAVRIRLVLEAGRPDRRRAPTESTGEGRSGEPPLVLETIVRLNLASLANSSVGGDTTTGQSGVTGSGPTPGAPGN
jgi:type II secretion system protein J